MPELNTRDTAPFRGAFSDRPLFKRHAVRRVMMAADAISDSWPVTMELVRAFCEHEVEVAVALTGPEPSQEQLREFDTLSNAELYHGDYALEWTENPWRDVNEAGEWLKNLEQDFQPDIVHLNGYVYGALEWRAPVLISAHSRRNIRRREGHRAELRFGGEYRHRILRGLEAASCVITPTTAFRKELEKEYDIALRGVTIPISRAANCSMMKEKKQNVIFSETDPLDEEEGWLQPIASDLRWPVFFGKATRQNGWDGTVDANCRSAFASQMALASICAVPLRYEPRGLAILDAALNGCALVLSDLPDFRELWGGCAEFVEVNNRGAWIKTLNALSLDRVKRDQMGIAARTQALQYSPARSATAHLQAYRSAIAKRTLAPA